MNDLDALLAGIVADPANAVRWLVMADWLEENGQPERAELVRVHRELLRTCANPDTFPERVQLHARLMELLGAGVLPCLPQRSVALTGGVELRLSFIPPGSFRMGSPDTESGRDHDEPPHPVTLTRGFYLGVSPVTQLQWRAVMGENPSGFLGDERPVETVSWEGASDFCRTVSELAGCTARLPTEAEWEWACRSGTATAFYWGGQLNGTQANCNGTYPHGTEEVGPHLGATSAVGHYAEVSPHPWGLVDMIGNVWEWCADWYDADFYGRSPGENPRCEVPARAHRVLRGGSWVGNPSDCRAADRNGREPPLQSDHIGFRVAIDPG